MMSFPENLGMKRVSGDSAGKQGVEGRFRLVVFLMGVFAAMRNGFEKLAVAKWLGLWPFWQQEKKLERLIEKADAKQNELLVELNKHRFCSKLCKGSPLTKHRRARHNIGEGS